jgi:hypothetical protein
MTPVEFVACVAKEKEEMLVRYFDAGSGSSVAKDIAAFRFTPEQGKELKKILDGALTDAFYTLLLALDGEASLGGQQRTFELRDEDGTILTGGELEGPAWEIFHGEASK